MPEQVQSSASLLTLSPAKPPRSESARDTAGDFGAELNAAVEENEPIPTEAPATDAAKSEPAGAEASATNVQAVSVEAAMDEEALAEQSESEVSEVVEEGDLLATFVVTETIVLETPPGAVLPEDAVTLIDVDSTAVYGVAFASDAEGSATNGSATHGSATQSPVFIDANAVIEMALNSQGDTSADRPDRQSAIAGDAVVAQPMTVIDSDTDNAQPISGQQQGEGDELLKQTGIGAAVDLAPPETDPISKTETASTKPHNTEAIETPASTLTSATEATLAVAPLPHEAGSEPDESRTSESADGVDVNASEDRSSRDTARLEAADKATPTERPNIDPARFVSRVSRAIEFADQRGGGPVEMRLSPPELGSLQVKIQVKDGVMTAKLEVETPAARNALLDNLPALRDRLEQQQIRIDKFDVDVRDQQQQRGGDWRQHQDQRQQLDQQQPQRHDPRAPRQSATTVAAPLDSRPVRTISFANNGINLVV